MQGLARLAARREDVVMTTAFLIQFGVSLRQVTNGNKSLKNNNFNNNDYSFPGSDLSCPAKDTKCAAPDGSNVIMRMSTEDDADCGG